MVNMWLLFPMFLRPQGCPSSLLRCSGLKGSYWVLYFSDKLCSIAFATSTSSLETVFYEKPLELSKWGLWYPYQSLYLFFLWLLLNAFLDSFSGLVIHSPTQLLTTKHYLVNSYSLWGSACCVCSVSKKLRACSGLANLLKASAACC